MDLKIASPERRADARLRRIVSLIAREREHQRRRWTDEADKRRTPADWIAVLSIFIGKAAMETPLYQAKLSTTSFKKRIVQIAAICMAILEAIDEGGTDEG